MLKKADAFAGDEEATERFPESVLSGLTVEEVRDGSARDRDLARHAGGAAPVGEVDAARQPVMLASLAETPFSDPAWLYEIKYDGVRVLAARDGARVTLHGRTGQDFTGALSGGRHRAARAAARPVRARRRGRRPRRGGAAVASSGCRTACT